MKRVAWQFIVQVAKPCLCKKFQEKAQKLGANAVPWMHKGNIEYYIPSIHYTKSI